MGTVTVSIDAELAWGFHDLPSLPANRIENARPSWRILVELLDEFEIPATWAVVGHLFLDHCDGIHEDQPSPKNWFRRDPGGNVETNKDWFGSDLIELVQDAKVNHEIASHTFSHLLCGADDVTEEIVNAELQRSKELAKADGIELSSFVFPRGSVGHKRLLADNEFICYRSRSPNRWLKEQFGRPGKFLQFNFGREPPPIATPTIDEFGLVDIPESLDLFSFEKVIGSITRRTLCDPVVRQAKLGIDEVSGSDGVFHMWLHPNNIVNHAGVERLERIFSYVQSHVRSSNLQIETMEDIARRHLG